MGPIWPVGQIASRLLQKLRAQHQALDLVGAAFDFVFIVGEMDAPDHGAAFEHGGGALQLEVFDQCDAVAFDESCAVGVPDLDVHGGVLCFGNAAPSSLLPLWEPRRAKLARRWRGCNPRRMRGLYPR